MHVNFKRAAIILAVLTLAISLIPTFTPAVDAAEPTGYGYALLKTEYEKTAYKNIAEGIANLDREIEFRFEIANYQETLKDQYVQEIMEATQKALRLVMADHPEFFWFDGDGGLSIYHDSWTSFKVVFQTHEYSVNGTTVTKSNIGQYTQRLDAVVNQILKDMPKDSDLRKIHHLHDYLAEHIDYEFGEDDQTIYGALVEGKAVCAGYARAYQYLLTKAGIQCWYVTGYSISPSTMNQVAHAWNLVYLNGKCYYTDVTWDDQGEVFHAYYMLSLSEIGQSHFPDHPEDLPATCGHKDLDYFEVHKNDGIGVGVLTGSYNANQVANAMKKTSSDTWSCHVEDLTGGGPQSFVTWLQQNQGAVAAALGITGGYKWSISTLWDEYQITFQSLPNVHYHDTVLIGQAAKNPTCTESGNIGYFVCKSCGAWFKNWNGTEEIYDKDSVKIPALDHSYTKQVKDGDQHWYECKDCGQEQPESREFHYDNNRNGKCDVCNAAVEVPTEPPTQPPATTPTTVPTTPPTTPPTQAPTTAPSTTPTTEPTVGPSEEPSTTTGSEPTIEPTESSSQQPTDTPVTAPSEGGQTEPTEGTDAPSQPTDSAETEPSLAPAESSVPTATGYPSATAQTDNTLMPVLIGAGVVAAALIVTAIILLTKKKR